MSNLSVSSCKRIQMNIDSIKTKKGYLAALKEIEYLFNAAPKTASGDRLEILTFLIEAYEEKHYQIDSPNPIDLTNYRAESCN